MHFELFISTMMLSMQQSTHAHGIFKILSFENSLLILCLTPKGQMVFFEFWSGSHLLDVHPNDLLF